MIQSHQLPWRKPFVSVYRGAAAQMMGQFVGAYSRRHREEREQHIQFKLGFRPAYRINIRLKDAR